ncbi:MAG: bacillithiol biosynthesis cysteine-adding enzyme BshC [Cytophagales bacterium]|nr:MAG: bacillithiol biosynthesis cysteine-adding enzyme BshC [Cytophagales bacterium]
MQSTSIAFEKTKAFSKAFKDYLQEKEALKDFYQHPPQINYFAQQIALKEKQYSSQQRAILVNTLKKQYQNTNFSPISETLQLLEKENTFTVCTGHQLCLLTGPAYFIYKIITTINLANSLKKQYPQYNFIPFYWLASEDHDFEEVNHLYLFGQKYTWESQQKGAVGRFTTTDMQNFWETISPKLNENVAELPKIYQESKNLAEATRKIVHWLFPNEAIVCIDGDDPQFKATFTHILEDELIHQNTERIINQSNALFAQKGYEAPITPREINLFYLTEQLRQRIIKNGETQWQVLNTDLQFSSTEIKQMLQENPEKFSPNVLMRPLYQETLLPNLAYIGGPAELVYWLPLKPLFDFYQLPMPILMPRNFALYINNIIGKKIQKLQLAPEELFLTEQQLKNDFLQKQGADDFQLREEEQTLITLFAEITQKAKQVDASLEGYVQAEKQKNLDQLKNIEKRIKKALEQKSKTEIDQLQNLKNKLFPEDQLQERVENFLNFYLNNPEWIAQMQNELDPFHHQFYIVYQ